MAYHGGPLGEIYDSWYPLRRKHRSALRLPSLKRLNMNWEPSDSSEEQSVITTERDTNLGDCGRHDRCEQYLAGDVVQGSVHSSSTSSQEGPDSARDSISSSQASNGERFETADSTIFYTAREICD